jgi:hypothetical protein
MNLQQQQQPQPEASPADVGGNAGDQGTGSGDGGEELYDLYEGDEGPSDDPQGWYRWRNLSIPCFIRPPVLGGLSGRPSSGGGPNSTFGSGGFGGGGRGAQGEPQALHLNITTCAVRPNLVLR